LQEGYDSGSMRDSITWPAPKHPSIRGVHSDIEWAAYQLLRYYGLTLPIPFPRLRLSTFFFGPEFKWLLGRFPASYSRYNPKTRQGGLPNSMKRTYEALKSRLESGRGTISVLICTVGHLAVDASDPAHYNGRPGQRVDWIEPIPVKSDWIDPYTGSVSSPNERHNHFELDIARLRRAYTGVSAIFEEIGPRYSEQLAGINRLGMRVSVIRFVEVISSEGIWEWYISKGWSSVLAIKISSWLLPRAIAFLAVVGAACFPRLCSFPTVLSPESRPGCQLHGSSGPKLHPGVLAGARGSSHMTRPESLPNRSWPGW
jgi:hypothetical protein